MRRRAHMPGTPASSLAVFLAVYVLLAQLAISSPVFHQLLHGYSPVESGHCEHHCDDHGDSGPDADTHVCAVTFLANGASGDGLFVLPHFEGLTGDMPLAVSETWARPFVFKAYAARAPPAGSPTSLS